MKFTTAPFSNLVIVQTDCVVRYVASIAFILFWSPMLEAQDIRQRIILIGDGGELSSAQSIVMREAANKVLSDKTTVFFLGDNIYPRGMGLDGSKEEKESHEILQSQYKPMRAKGAPVYFVPGNHDWDRSGTDGLEKMKAVTRYIEKQQDSLLHITPANGCPDPYEIVFSDNITVIAMDTEWWLFPFNKENLKADCACKTKDEVIAALDELVYKNRHKVILLTTHHPFVSYGHHGGYFNLKDHLFPLTAVNHKLLIPLPVVGSLYPILRRTFPVPEDMHHPLYRNMIERVTKSFSITPNVVYASGHEHGLQLIKKDSTPLQVVTGAGAKQEPVRQHKDPLLFGKENQGFVTADLLQNNDLLLTYYEVSGDSVRQIFQHEKKYEAVKEREQTVFQPVVHDSVTIAVHPDYDKHGKFYRVIFGENYRKDYATPVTLPVIHVSTWAGGLTPIKRGGGNQTLSLRLRDKAGKDYVLRGLDKHAEKLLPELLQTSFARDVIVDAVTAQHPFSPLIVPVLANAAGVPHANPIIGLVAPEKELGHYVEMFGNTICLLEEREPLGKSDNTIEMWDELESDNDNSVDGKAFLKARLLDLFIGDWDRHPDQWRWKDNEKGKQKSYVPVPRDRDQALYRNEGLMPTLVSQSWLVPLLQGFEGDIPHVEYSMKNSSFINPLMASQFSYEAWMKISDEFAKAMTDSVIETALKKLPDNVWKLRHAELEAELKARRDHIPAAMDEYYKFAYRIVDIKATHKNEYIEIKDTLDQSLKITVYKFAKDKKEQVLMSNVYTPSITSEINIYLRKGDDHVVIDNATSPIKLRIVGGKGKKEYTVEHAARKVDVYDRTAATFKGDDEKFKKYIDDDSVNTAFTPYNPYKYTMPLVAGGINLDDGLILGAGFKTVHQGFRKKPYGNVQTLTFAHSFSTGAFRLRYNGTWIHAVGKADFILDAVAKAPNNTQNFFGRGNDTEIVKYGHKWIKYYRTRFSLFEVNPSLRWYDKKGTSLSVGPSIQHYRFDADDNEGRFINNVSAIDSYDSATIDKPKTHAGALANFTLDRRDNKIFSTWGTFVNVKIIGYKGLDAYSRSFVQVLPEVALYKSVTANSSIVVAERLGGGFTFGSTTFYQSVFLGGHDNLYGFRQYRFAGQNAFYNNLEVRWRLATLPGYLLPGELGITSLYDIGRVWEKGESSSTWHHGAGAGLYFAPARIVVFQVVAARSKEGWFPFFNMKFRY
jgi:hypothetical protein